MENYFLLVILGTPEPKVLTGAHNIFPLFLLAKNHMLPLQSLRLGYADENLGTVYVGFGICNGRTRCQDSKDNLPT